MIKKFAFLLSVFLLASCSSADKSNEKKVSNYEDYIIEKKLESIDKINAFRYQGWRSLDNKFLIINTSVSKQYLIQLSAYCAELRYANAILINNQGASLRTRIDSIRVAKDPRMKCMIKSIYPITKEQSEELTAFGRS